MCSEGEELKAAYVLTLSPELFARRAARATEAEFRDFCNAPRTAAAVKTLHNTLRAGAQQPACQLCSCSRHHTSGCMQPCMHAYKDNARAAERAPMTKSKPTTRPAEVPQAAVAPEAPRSPSDLSAAFREATQVPAPPATKWYRSCSADAVRANCFAARLFWCPPAAMLPRPQVAAAASAVNRIIPRAAYLDAIHDATGCVALLVRWRVWLLGAAHVRSSIPHACPLQSEQRLAAFRRDMVFAATCGCP